MVICNKTHKYPCTRENLYRVRWYGYWPNSDTWEPFRHLPRSMVLSYFKRKDVPASWYRRSNWQPALTHSGTQATLVTQRSVVSQNKNGQNSIDGNKSKTTFSSEMTSNKYTDPPQCCDPPRKIPNSVPKSYMVNEGISLKKNKNTARDVNSHHGALITLSTCTRHMKSHWLTKNGPAHQVTTMMTLSTTLSTCACILARGDVVQHGYANPHPTSEIFHFPFASYAQLADYCLQQLNAAYKSIALLDKFNGTSDPIP